MKIVEQYPFTFADAIFDVYWTDARTLLIPLRQLCQALGLDFSSQLQRVKRDVILGKHLHTVQAKVAQSDGRVIEQDLACISYRRLEYWMGTVDHMRVKAELRDKLILFKEEMADALHAYFRSQTLPEDMLAELDASLSPDKQQFYRLMAQAKQVHDHDREIKSLEERVGKLEARLVGTDFISREQAAQYLGAVSALGDLLKTTNKKMASPYAVIHNEVKKQFKVASYQLIPESDFEKVMLFLGTWWAKETPARPPQVFIVRQNRLI
jgi:hypothetical protein